MKKTLLLSMLGLAALLPATSSYAVGGIFLDNYVDSNSSPLVTYGYGWGALSGTGLLNGTPGGVSWTVGFYYAIGDVRGSVASDPLGLNEPSALGGGLTLATGDLGDTATIWNAAGAGYFVPSFNASIRQGWTSGPITIELVAFSGGSFASSIFRGHSDAFLMTPALLPQIPPDVGNFMPPFAVNIPEPSAFALVAMSGATMLMFRRRK